MLFMRRAHQVCLRAVHKLRGKHNPRGEYEAVDQHHATVQMSDMEGMSILHASASEHQEHEELQVLQQNYLKFSHPEVQPSIQILSRIIPLHEPKGLA